ncbi:hypothetical protein BN3662_01088 [Clostridiales bacterium CHKCI006]|nr:hypothetical protein BN3662_01088 [Clostridiales bacterium CHKCI006]
MMISDKITHLLRIRKCKAIAYSNAMGLNKQIALKKYKRKSFQCKT